MDISGKHVLVTGGFKGVGAALVAVLLAKSARVTIAARPSAELDKLATLPGVAAMPVDLADFDALDGYIVRIEKANGPLDVLINNAALVTSGSIAHLKRQDLHHQIAANLLAPMELCRQALPGMLNRDAGVIANVSSMVAEISIPNLPAYAASKAGLSKFTTDLQGDLRRLGKPTTSISRLISSICTQDGNCRWLKALGPSAFLALNRSVAGRQLADKYR